MNKNALKLITIFGFLGLLTPTLSKAADYSSAHLLSRSDFQEHVATGYAITFTSYLIYRKNLEMTPESSVLTSVATSLVLGFVRDQYLFKHGDIGNYMKATAAGTTASTLINLTIKF